MATLLYSDVRFADHTVPAGHPERPERLSAVAAGVRASAVSEQLLSVAPRLASIDELSLVHDRAYLDALERFCRSGGGHLDPDTSAVAASFDVARLSAGAGLDAVERLNAGEADAAFLAVRPPGHHALPARAMGFCLLNSVAVTAAALAAAGQRVLIVDIDAHHGNGTQAAFWDDPRVLYVSMHEWPAYPYSGEIDETGGPEAPGTNCNLPFPAGTTGDAYRRAVDEVVVPLAERFAPHWLLLSTGFDAHRADPITDLGLSSGDYHDLTARLLALVPAARTVVFLEGGYDLDAVAASTAATLAALAHVELHPEPVTGRGPGSEVVARARRIHDLG